LLAAAEALCSATRFSRKAILFNSGMLACSTFLTFVVTRALFGELSTLHHGPFSGKFMLALCVMAFVQYASNSMMAAIYTSLKMAEPLWHSWTKYYLWASITYFAGASAAGFTVKFADAAGVYGLLATAPIVAVLYFTYRTYLRNIEVMSAAAKAEGLPRTPKRPNGTLQN
jgi:hypothetical protein